MTRMYVRTTYEAQSAVADIIRLVKGGHVDPVVSFDTETMPIAGLEQYPGTSFDDEGDRIKPTKKQYLEYTQARWADSFHPDFLTMCGLRVPRKTTAGNELPGVPAKAAWAELRQQLQRVTDDELNGARFSSHEQVLTYQGRLEQEIAQQEAILAEFSGVKGKKKVVEAAKAELEHLQWRLTRVSTMLERVEQPLDVKLLRHIVAVGVENRVKVDPVRPGLDPFTSDIFTVQITLRRTLNRELVTWVFNTGLVELEVLRPLFKLGRAYTYMAHNAKFDLKLLMAKLGLDAAPRNVFCTRIGSRMLYLGLKIPHNLKSVAARFAGIKMDKATRDTFIGVRRPEPTEEQLEYGAMDTEALFPIYDAQMKTAESRGQVELLREFSKLSWITALWELRGYTIDEEKWLAIAAQAANDRDELAGQLEKQLLPEGYSTILGGSVEGEDDLEALEELLNEQADNDSDDSPSVDTRRNALIRISQTKLVCERLVEVLGERVARAAFPNGKVSLEKTARGGWERAYRAAHGGQTHPFFRLYELWSKRAKQASTYGRRFLWAVHPLTGAIHPSLNIAGTDTGRYSSTQPNMLNVPAAKEEGDPDYRGAFICPLGFYLLGGDMEAMELRIAGNVTLDQVVKRMIEAGGDPHSFSAAMMFHIRRGNVREPKRIEILFKYGTDTYTIYGYEVPQNWTAEQVAELALSKEVQSWIKTKTPKDKEAEVQFWKELDARDPKLARVLKKSPTRTLAKMVTFLWLFRGSAFTLAVRTGLPLEQCEDAFERFNTVYVEMARGMDALAELVLENCIEGRDGTWYAWSEAYGGLRRWFALPDNPSRRDFEPGWTGDAKFERAQKEYKRRLRSVQREACNVPMQGGNAVVTAKALNQMVESGYAMAVFPWLAVYDEIICIVPDTVKPEVVKAMLEDAVLDTANEYMTYIPCGFEADLGKVSRVWVKS